jgi:hypothetical protein
MADDKKQKIKVLDGSNTPMYKGHAYYEEPSMMEKAKITAKNAASKFYDDMLKMGRATGKPEKEVQPVKELPPSDIADQLQTMKNERAAAAYEKRRAAGEDYKKGGKVKCMSKGGSASSRADGIAVRGKTRGTIC